MLRSPSNQAAPSLRRAVHAARGRWRIEQDYRELKDELGLNHFEGRVWHHHVTLVSLAFCFLRSEQARSKKNFWCDFAEDEIALASEPNPNGGTLSLVQNDV